MFKRIPKTCVIMGTFWKSGLDVNNMFESATFGPNENYKTANDFIVEVRNNFRKQGYTLNITNLVIE